MNRSITKDVTCIGCGCVCDDIEIHSERNRIIRAEAACELGQAWFLHHNSDRSLPDSTIDGRPATLDEGIETAIDLLQRASYPLVYGLGQSSCEAAREAVALAEWLGGALDSHTSLTHGPTKTAAQLVGKVACTLGEVRNRADLIVYWGSNPVESHPRHLSRYTLNPAGKYVPGGRGGRTMVVVDVRETPTAGQADSFLQIRPGADFEVLTALRAVLQERPVHESLAAVSGLSLEQLLGLAERMKKARFGVLFFGSGLTATRGKHMNAAAALTLVAELNQFTKFVAVPMRDHGNEAGVDHVFTWITGYPFGVDYSRGYPRSNPGEFTATDLLVRGEVDAAIIVGDGPWAMLPKRALDRLADIPTVVLDSKLTSLSRLARVHITTAATGINSPGTVYRMDKIPLPLRPAIQSPYPSEAEVIERIREAISVTPHVPRCP